MAVIIIDSSLVRSMLEHRRKDVKDVAAKLKLRGDFGQIASTNTEVSFEDIKQIAAYFKKPWSYMLKEGPEKIPDFGHDNRTLNNRQTAISSEMLTELKLAEYRLDSAAELFPDFKVLWPNVKLNSRTDVEKTAEIVREFLEVSVDEQLKSGSKHAALNLWVDALQAKGVYVSQRKLVDDTVRAFSIQRNGYGLIVVDTEYPYARIFSLLHEYCHILMHSAGICDLELLHNGRERYCNEFAASVMLPRSLLSNQLKGFKFSGTVEEDEETIKKLSEHFRISQASLLIRLKNMGHLDEKYYQQLEIRRRNRKSIPKKVKGGSYYASAIASAGKRFAQNVVGALSEGTINRTDASVLLGVGEHVIDRFQRELFTSPGGKK